MNSKRTPAEDGQRLPARIGSRPSMTPSRSRSRQASRSWNSALQSENREQQAEDAARERRNRAEARTPSERRLKTGNAVRAHRVAAKHEVKAIALPASIAVMEFCCRPRANLSEFRPTAKEPSSFR